MQLLSYSLSSPWEGALGMRLLYNVYVCIDQTKTEKGYILIVAGRGLA